MCDFSPEAVRDFISVKLQKHLQANPENFLFNELALQMFVARTLEDVFNPEEFKVHLEYSLPIDWNMTFKNGYSSWKTETPYIDIVLEKKGKDGSLPMYIAIELKNKLEEVKLPKDISFLRFGQEPNPDLKSGLVLVKDQGAQDEGRYDFWKDVKRIELLTEAFPNNVIGGFSLFLTNDPYYTQANEGCKYYKFGFKQNMEAGLLFWNNNSSRCKSLPMCMRGEKFFMEKYPDLTSWSTNPGEEIECGTYEHCKICGEKFNKSKDGVERPNFSLTNNYKGEWFPNEKGFMDAMNNRFYCYSVVIPKWES